MMAENGKPADPRQELGRAGESAAAAHLERTGYAIRDRNFRCTAGEIDLIATKGDFLVFIEVKTRKSGSQVHPSLSVTRQKQGKVRQVGEIYRAANPQLVLQPRFDVISVEMGQAGAKVEHIENAF